MNTGFTEGSLPVGYLGVLITYRKSEYPSLHVIDRGNC